jgi:hypothetical protein
MQKQKKLALRTPSRPKASRAGQDSGLIAKAATLKPSARTTSAVDNRSHRTRERAHGLKASQRAEPDVLILLNFSHSPIE